MSSAKPIQVPPPPNVKFTKTGRAYAEMSTLVEGDLYEKIEEAVRQKREEANTDLQKNDNGNAPAGRAIAANQSK